MWGPHNRRPIPPTKGGNGSSFVVSNEYRPTHTTPLHLADAFDPAPPPCSSLPSHSYPSESTPTFDLSCGVADLRKLEPQLPFFAPRGPSSGPVNAKSVDEASNRNKNIPIAVEMLTNISCGTQAAIGYLDVKICECETDIVNIELEILLTDPVGWLEEFSNVPGNEGSFRLPRPVIHLENRSLERMKERLVRARRDLQQFEAKKARLTTRVDHVGLLLKKARLDGGTDDKENALKDSDDASTISSTTSQHQKTSLRHTLDSGGSDRSKFGFILPKARILDKRIREAMEASVFREREDNKNNSKKTSGNGKSDGPTVELDRSMVLDSDDDWTHI